MIRKSMICNACRTVPDIDSRWSNVWIRKMLTADGWVCDTRHRDYCPKCVKKGLHIETGTPSLYKNRKWFPKVGDQVVIPTKVIVTEIHNIYTCRVIDPDSKKEREASIRILEAYYKQETE